MKNVKDPIYGYIKIDDDYFDNVIDTPSFQRLRNIRQIGYQSLYPSALPSSMHFLLEYNIRGGKP